MGYDDWKLEDGGENLGRGFGMETPCITPRCEEPASPGSSWCNSCHVFNEELAAIRQREQNEAIVTRYLRSEWKAS